MFLHSLTHMYISSPPCPTLNVTCIFQAPHILPRSQLRLHLVSVLHVLHQDLQSLALFAQKVEDPGKAIGTERGGQTLEGLEELNIAAPFPCFLQRRERRNKRKEKSLVDVLYCCSCQACYARLTRYLAMHTTNNIASYTSHTKRSTTKCNSSFYITHYKQRHETDIHCLMFISLSKYKYSTSQCHG